MSAPPASDDGGTAAAAYADRLRRLEGRWWKRVLDTQRPYRWHLSRLRLGRTLDIGCGVGRHLRHLSRSGQAVGVDHNREAVAACREQGLEAFLPDELAASRHGSGASFDSLLLSHVVEHLPFDGASALLGDYLPYLRPGGRVVLVTPQERGFASDSTHVEWMDFDRLRALATANGLSVLQAYSFPFPRWAGRLFTHNEFVVIARKPAASSNEREA